MVHNHHKRPENNHNRERSHAVINFLNGVLVMGAIGAGIWLVAWWLS